MTDRSLSRLGVGLVVVHLRGGAALSVMGSAVTEALVRRLETAPVAELEAIAQAAGARVWREEADRAA